MMNKAQPTAEPEVEDLLASIRKAIAHEASLPADRRPGQGPAITGSMRESWLRRVDDPALATRAGEILELRNRISSQLGRGEPDWPEGTRLPAAAAANGFAGILGGELPMPAQSRTAASNRNATSDPPFLRGGFARSEVPADAGYEGQAQSYADEPSPRHAEPSRGWPEPPPRHYPPLADPRAERGGVAADPGMMSQDSASAASAAFNRLAETLMARATGERPIEDITRELLRSMLKQWLDEHLPGLVERMVREEIERVARRGPLR